MGYYSFVAYAKEDTGISDPFIQLGPGRNVFTAHTDNLDGLLAQLREVGADVQQVNNLGGQEALSKEDLLLLTQGEQLV